MRRSCHHSPALPRLYLYSRTNYNGSRYVWRGNVGIRSLDRLYHNRIESLRFYSPESNGTLVLFSRPNFRGEFVVFRSTTNIPDLNNIINGQRPQSLFIARCLLSDRQIRFIRRNARLPLGYRTV